MIKVHLYKTKGRIIPQIIRFMTFSRWNHVGITVDDVYYESEYGRGVTVDRNKHEAFYEDEYVIYLNVGAHQLEAVKRFLKDQVGKPYDIFAIFALPFRSRWQRPDKWFCSELVAAALKEGDIAHFPYEASRITPRDLYIGLNNNKFKKAEIPL